MPPPSLAATSRVPGNDEGLAPFTEVARVSILFSDLPQPCHTDAIRMKQAAKTFPVRAPTQVCVRIDGSLCGLTENVRFAEGQDSTQNTGQCNRVNGQRPFAIPPPHLLVGIGEKSIPDFRESRSFVGAIFCGSRFCAK